MGKPATVLARKLLDISLKDGQLNQERISAILEALRNSPPRNYKQVLEHYLLKVGAELRKENAYIEYAGSLSEEMLESVKKDLTQYYNRNIKITTKENPELLAGLKIRVADDVWDASVAGRLEKLADAF